MSERRESNRFGKGIGYPKQGDGERRRGLQCSIASQTLCPGESVVCPLCPRKRSRWWGLSRWRGISPSDVNALATKELDQHPPMGATLPVSPEHWMRTRCGWGFPWCR